MIEEKRQTHEVFTERAFDSLVVWYEFLDRTYPELREFAFNNIPRESSRFAVFVDHRKHPYTEYAIRNVMHFLGPEWGLQVFVWPNNRRFIEKITDGWQGLNLVVLGNDVGSPDDIKRLSGFWQMLKGERQLFFDFDTILRNGKIEPFLKYDFVAPPWNSSLRPEPEYMIGSGGFSLRNKEVMMDICNTFGAESVNFAKEEDFSLYGLQQNTQKYVLPQIDVAKRFAVECEYHPDPFGLHKPWMCLTPEELRPLLEKIHYK